MQYRHIIILSLTILLSFHTNLISGKKSVSSDSYSLSKSTADSLYTANNYSSAIAIYTKILKEKGVSPELYYNLGNCYYKQNDMAHAILNYERALKLDPSDTEIRDNLSLSRSKIQDKNNAPAEFFIVAWWYSLSNFLSLPVLKTTGLLCFVLFLALILLLSIQKPENKKGYIKYLAIALLIFSVLANLAAYQQYHNSVSSKGAIVMSESASVSSSPSENGIELFIVHSGTRLTILDNSMKEWCKVKYEEGKEGWIPKKKIEII
jgi:tetratricopeptide (TPR) repeat protein